MAMDPYPFEPFPSADARVEPLLAGAHDLSGRVTPLRAEEALARRCTGVQREHALDTVEAARADAANR